MFRIVSNVLKGFHPADVAKPLNQRGQLRYFYNFSDLNKSIMLLIKSNQISQGSVAKNRIAVRECAMGCAILSLLCIFVCDRAR